MAEDAPRELWGCTGPPNRAGPPASGAPRTGHPRQGRASAFFSSWLYERSGTLHPYTPPLPTGCNRRLRRRLFLSFVTCVLRWPLACALRSPSYCAQ